MFMGSNLTNLEMFEKRLQQLQDELGIRLQLSIYKNALDDEYCRVQLTANEEKSVHLHRLIDLDLKYEKGIWYKYYK